MGSTVQFSLREAGFPNFAKAEKLYGWTSWGCMFNPNPQQSVGLAYLATLEWLYDVLSVGVGESVIRCFTF